MRNSDHAARDAEERDFPLTVGYYVRLVGRRWWIPVSLALLGACLALVYTGLQDSTYRARATVLLSPLDPATADELTRLAPTVSRLLRSDRVLIEARSAYLAGSPDADGRAARPDDLRKRTAVVVPRDTSLFQVTADGPTQRDANALVRAVVESASRSVSNLGSRTSAAGEAAVPLGLDVFGPPVAEGAVSPTPGRNLIVGVNVGLLLGIVGALLLRDPRRARMRADRLAELLRASEIVYAPLPSARLLRDRPAPGAPTAPPSDARGEGIRLLGGRLWRWLQEDRRVVLLLGDLPPQRLRSVALALAAHLARTGAHPALVEADFHGGGWDVARGGNRGDGLGDLLERAEDGGGIAVQTTSLNGDGPGRFTVVPRGERPSEPALAFASEPYRALLDRLRERHELLIVVGPATEWQAEVAALAERADAVVLLVPPWVAHSRAAALTTLHSARTDASLVVSVFGDAEDVPLAASREL
jgi:capsular polysaccharide biosynthesis protein